MKQMKHVSWALFAMILALCLTAGVARAEEASPWSYDAGNMYLIPAENLSGDVTIPSEVDGYAVNAIKYNAFNSNNEITSLTMPDTLRAIQSGVISWMDGLTSVTLNDGLEYIGSNFTDCNALTSLTIPASVRIIDSAFSSCENLKEITFEGACPVFLNADWCFNWLSDDYVIYVPDDQLEAYAEALADSFDAAAHLQPSGKNAPAREEQDKGDWFTFDAETGTITGYAEYHAYVEIPESIGGVAVKAIGECAFASDYSVYVILFPEGLESVGAGAFQHASNLSYVRFPSSLRQIGNDAFMNAQIDRIDWSEGLEEIGARAFMYDHADILTLPSTVRTIGEEAFKGSWCQELYLSGELEHIGARAFAETALDYLVFDFYEPIDIAADAFADTYVADLDLPWDSSFENRDAYAAMLKDQCPDCTVWINNPSSAGVAEEPVNEAEITTIENGVWTAYHGDQQDLTIWTVYDDIQVTALGDGLFKGNQTIRSFYPHHCGWFTTIGSEAFADSSVEYVEFFGSLTTIGDEAFRNCVNLTSAVLPESLTDLGQGAFCDCVNLAEVTLPSSLTALEKDVFRNCTGLTALTLPESLTSIGEGALSGCTGLTELTLPASLTALDPTALEGCSGLKKLIVLCDPAVLPEELSGLLSGLEELYAAPDATDEQVRLLSRMAGRAWYDLLPRVGEEVFSVQAMPYEPLPGSDFWYDEEYSRLDAYQGYELNLILPREIDGVPLTMIGGGMMTRASYGDNFDVELPVVSLVIPENYTEIPAFAFANCETLETVICYAPLENLPEGLFKNCVSLREVVFVNGVRRVDRYVFDGCTSLETVYLGRCVEEVSEYAFLNADGSAAFEPQACLTDPAQRPDVDALLAAVKCDPMPTPEPTATPAPAVPVGEAGAPFLGEWYGQTMEMEGATYSLSDFDMTMVLTFHEDGTATLYDGEEEVESTWTVTDGVAVVDGTPLTLQESGELWMEEDGAKIVFTREGEAPAPQNPTEPEQPAAPVSAESDAFLGAWYGQTMEMEGATYSLSDFDMTMVLTFHEDGTATLYDGEEEVESTWTVTDGVAVVDGTPLTLQESGELWMEEDGAKIVFTREGEAPAPQNPTEPEQPAAPVSGEELPGEYIGTWHACYLVTGGLTGDPRTLGLQITLTLNGDGTGSITFPAEEEKSWYRDEETGTVFFGVGGDAADMPMTLLDGGFLCYGSRAGDGNALGGYILFSQDPDAVWTDSGLDGTLESRLEVRFVCVNAEASGYLMDASMLGGEYAMTFHEDGTMEFILVGVEAPGVTWTQGKVETEDGEEADAFLIDYYGNVMEAIWTEEGLDLNYFDSMLMHFVPEPEEVLGE